MRTAVYTKYCYYLAISAIIYGAAHFLEIIIATPFSHLSSS